MTISLKYCKGITELHKLLVKTTLKNYNVYVGDNSLEEFRKNLSANHSKVLFLIDKNVFKKCLKIINKILPASKDYHHIIIECSEKNKSIKTVEKVCKYLSNNKFDRKSVLVSIGGGVLGDVTGFCASIYMRGIKCYQIPTTILSAVDGSVGGKTGINFNGIKNLIGTFYQPDGVFVETEFFKTLPRREVISGIGELVKYALIIPKLYNFFLEEIKKIYLNREVSIEVIITSLKIKSEIVNKDEKEETGLRKILNLGHTFAHGFESASDYKLTHGKAVFYGIICALLISERLGLIDNKIITQFLNDFGFINREKFVNQLDTQKIINFMKSDKKNFNGTINLVLVSKSGILTDVPIKEKAVFTTIEKFKKMFG